MKRKLCLTVMIFSMFCILAGCRVRGSRNIIVADDADTVHISVSISDDNSDYKLAETADGFDVIGGDEVVHGSLLSASDADLLNSEQYGKGNYNTVSIGSAVGFAYIEDGSYVHVFQPDGMDVSVRLTAGGAESNIYAVEECLSFSVGVKEKE